MYTIEHVNLSDAHGLVNRIATERGGPASGGQEVRSQAAHAHEDQAH